MMIHGGAGPRKMSRAQAAYLSSTLRYGYDRVHHGDSALAVVEMVIALLEGSNLFNAGLGARVQQDGVKRMDASIMEGAHLRAGAVASVERVRHPIRVARLVLEQTNHVLLVGAHAKRLAIQHHLSRRPYPPPTILPESLRTGGTRKRTRAVPELETVGAVVLDQHGSMAAGASTGGIGSMLPGRVGDTPLIGSGVYADNESGAVSMTGIGESIIRIAVAKEVTDLLGGGMTPARAGRRVLDKLVRRVHGFAGALILSPTGRFSIRHTSPYMAAGYWNGKGRPVVADCFQRGGPGLQKK